MMLDRKTPPQRYPAQSVASLKCEPTRIANGLTCYEISGGTEDIVKIDIVFKAGTRYEPAPLIASVCVNTLQEGTINYTATEISETIDFYGATISKNLSKDYAEVSLLCQGAHLKYLIDFFTDIFMQPTFPQHKVDLYKNRAKSALAVNLEKVEIQCRMLFDQLLFQNHPYQNTFAPEDFDAISSEELFSFFNSHFHLNQAVCVISGKNTARAKDLLNASLAKKQAAFHNAAIEMVLPEWQLNKNENWIKREGSLQSAIRMGVGALCRNHPDYAALYVANVALGGYFGSRLMQNIREEKGYTYGISSTINILEHAAYLSISTQVGAQFTAQTIDEIKKELAVISSQLLTAEELELIQYYISGSLLRRFDGPFATADRLKSIVLNTLPNDWYPQFIQKIFSLTAQEILNVAQVYLQPQKFSLAVVGEF